MKSKFDPMFPTIENTVDAYNEAPPLRLPLRRIMRAVCEKYGITEQEFLGPSRRRTLVAIRRQAIFAAVENGASMAAIARAFNRDQTTIGRVVRNGGKNGS